MRREHLITTPWLAVGAGWFVRRALLLGAVVVVSLLFVQR